MINPLPIEQNTLFPLGIGIHSGQYAKPVFLDKSHLTRQAGHILVAGWWFLLTEGSISVVKTSSHAVRGLQNVLLWGF